MIIPGALAVFAALSAYAGSADVTDGACAIYALRKLSAAYGGPAITVRREGDNKTADIGFTDDGTLNLPDLRTFAAEGNVCVPIWHDQSGNGKHAVQNDPAKQPIIVNAGKLVRTPNRNPSLEFDGKRYLEIAENAYVSVSVVARSTETSFTEYRGILGGDGKPLHIVNGIANSTKIAAATKAFMLALRNGISVPFANGHDVSPLDEYNAYGFILPSALTQKAVIGATDPVASRGWKGNIAEIIVFPKAISKEALIAVSANQAAFFGIGTGDIEKKKLTEATTAMPPKVNIAPTDPLIDYSDFAHITKTPQYARFDRIIKAGGALENDNPGARIRFRTSAANIRALFSITALHQRQDSVNVNGIILVDGRQAGDYAAKPLGDIFVTIPVQPGGISHDYEILLPYGQSLDFLGLDLGGNGTLEKTVPRPQKRYVAYGDSITHGFQASRIDRNYPYQVGVALGYQVVNMGFGGRHAEETDGDAIAACKPDLVTILIGFNDRYHSRPLAEYKRHLGGLITRIRKASLSVPIFVITPIWSSEPAWASGTLGLSLEDYRASVREIVSGAQDTMLFLVDGLALMDNTTGLTTDGIHPNDKGFDQIAARLTGILKISLAQ